MIPVMHTCPGSQSVRVKEIRVRKEQTLMPSTTPITTQA